ncbi:hypothetical protein [Nesterenkonia pannonica]|uniref:hypothetical protein n=1 Tax=Nesterenkonia pannonica TaxID=1548602 RepID=UPI00216470C6|nr:hypothetical protein [Nesterenkonia pannonica]
MITRTRIMIGSALAATLGLTACGDGGESEASQNWREAGSVEDGGGMDQLVEDAQAEGQFNAMGLYEDWANYGELLEAFSEEYDIEITNDTSTGSSQDLINAVVNRQGQDNSWTISTPASASPKRLPRTACSPSTHPRPSTTSTKSSSPSPARGSTTSAAPSPSGATPHASRTAPRASRTCWTSSTPARWLCPRTPRPPRAHS